MYSIYLCIVYIFVCKSKRYIYLKYTNDLTLYKFRLQSLLRSSISTRISTNEAQFESH